MDLGQAVVVFTLGMASGVAVLAALRRRATRPPVPVQDRAARRHRVDATEAYISASIDWLFDRAVGNRAALAEFDAHVVGVPYGQVEVRLLSEDVALEYAALARWLWDREGRPIDPPDAAARVLLFRARLHDQLERQRTLAETGSSPRELSPEVAGPVGGILAEVIAYRSELVDAGDAPPPSG